MTLVERVRSSSSQASLQPGTTSARVSSSIPSATINDDVLVTQAPSTTDNADSSLFYAIAGGVIFFIILVIAVTVIQRRRTAPTPIEPAIVHNPAWAHSSRRQSLSQTEESSLGSVAYRQPQLRTSQSANRSAWQTTDLDRQAGYSATRGLEGFQAVRHHEPRSGGSYNGAVLRLQQSEVTVTQRMPSGTLQQQSLAEESDQPLWLTKLDREEAVAVVSAANRIGSFVVRPSSRPRAWAVTVQHPGEVRHHLVEKGQIRGFVVDDHATECVTLAEVVLLLMSDGRMLGTKLSECAIVDNQTSDS